MTSNKKSKNTNNDENNNIKQGDGKTLLVGPFQGMFELISPLFPSVKKSKKLKKILSKLDHPKDDVHMIVKLEAMEDMWKIYRVFKLTHQYMMY